ncbi:MAG: M23 family metallopeptidase [Verrucomicrobia bacterium]|nr:M23 family metallopeptidase [Verrucomicrobiota bacterium]
MSPKSGAGGPKPDTKAGSGTGGKAAASGSGKGSANPGAAGGKSTPTAAELAAKAEKSAAEAKAKADAAAKLLERTVEAKKAQDVERTKRAEARRAADEAAKARSDAEAKERAAMQAAQAASSAKAAEKAKADANAKTKSAEAAKAVETAKAKEALAAKLQQEAEGAAKITDAKAKAAGIGNAPLEKPPFSATPGGQKLSAGVPVTDGIKTVGTAQNPQAGSAGNVRNRGEKRHAGIDEKAAAARYTGAGEGKVVAATMDQRLGGYVTVEYKDSKGTTWEQRTMHMKELNVKVGDTVKPGDIIGRGMGAGDIFNAKDATPEHIHSEFRRDGRPVEPYSGRELDFNGTADVSERERAAERAKAEADRAAKEAAEAAKKAEEAKKKVP